MDVEMNDECQWCGKLPDLEEGDEWSGCCRECDQLQQDLRQRWPKMNAGLFASRMQQELKTRSRIEDLEWMLDADERDARVLAARLGYADVSGLDKLLERKRRRDLKARIQWRPPTSHAGLERQFA